MKLATTISDFEGYTASWADAVRQFAGTGFRYLDFSFSQKRLLEENWLDQVYTAKQAAKELGMSFVQAHAPGYNPFDPHADHGTGMLSLRRSIEACGILGIPHLVVHPGCAEDYRYPENQQAFYKANRQFYEKLFPAMETYDITVLTENSAKANMGKKCYFATGREMADFLEFCDHPLLQACWDTGHANLDSTDQYRDICDLGRHLRAVHFQDNFGTCDAHIAPWMGTLDIDAVMQGLLDTGYQGYLTFECGNMLLRKNTWPHYRQSNPAVRQHKLQDPPLELRRKAENLLFEIGKSVLCAYGCFEV